MEEDHVVRLLANPATYGVEDVQQITTATAHVFLTGKYAYKTNRTVQLSFLDYSTKEKRMEFMRREFEMNKAMNPSLYVELLKVTDAGLQSLSSSGEAHALVIKMNQVDPSCSMDNALAAGTVTPEHVKEVAQQVAAFHAATTEEPEFGTVETVKFNWDELFGHVEGGKEGFISAQDFAFVKEKIHAFLQNDIFDKRVSSGRIKFCHGDLHSANIFLADKVMLFDRITFNKRFPCSDVMSEVAFLAMDLEHHGKPELAHLFVDEYVKQSGDKEGLEVLTFYKCYRAWIRGCINYFDRKPEAKEYFELARKYAERL